MGRTGIKGGFTWHNDCQGHHCGQLDCEDCIFRDRDDLEMPCVDCSFGGEDSHCYLKPKEDAPNAQPTPSP